MVVQESSEKLRESFGMIPFPGCQWKVKVTGMLGLIFPFPKKGLRAKPIKTWNTFAFVGHE